MATKLPVLPPDHKAAMKVTKGGSCCRNCKHFHAPEPGEYSKSYGTCDQENYQDWAGTREIPEPADEYCSDWWEPKD